MRSLSKEVEVQTAASYIVTYLKNKFTPQLLQAEKEIEKLRKEKVILELQKEDLDD